MAKKDFILQGLTTRTHVGAVQELFDISNIKRVIISVAFITESGVELLMAKIQNCATKVTVFAGIRNDITSYQGLNRLLGLGVTLYAVDTGSRNVLFHPKLYLVRGNQHAGLVIGSANLTLGGLNNNIEAGLALNFDLSDGSDKAVVESIENQFDSSLTDFPDHLVKVSSATLLKDMLASGRLVDEMAIPPPRPTTAASHGSTDLTPRIKLKVKPLRKALAIAKKVAKSKKAVRKAKTSTTTNPPPASLGVELELMWESKPLTRRDLTIPTAANTHATGSINLDKGLLDPSVDQRHYFRDVVFENLLWTKTKNANIEEVYARFQLVVKNISHGEFDLRISHNTSTTSATYMQKNAMTRLSWGLMRPSIAKPDLIGRTITLYRDKAGTGRFVLEID
jgi:HKD family nuclease